MDSYTRFAQVLKANRIEDTFRETEVSDEMNADFYFGIASKGHAGAIQSWELIAKYVFFLTK